MREVRGRSICTASKHKRSVQRVPPCPTMSTPPGSRECGAFRCSDGEMKRKNSSMEICDPCPSGSACRDDKMTTCLRTTYSDEGSPRCITCTEGTFALSSGASTCTTCPKHRAATCEGGEIKISDGHWFADDELNEDTVIYTCIFTTDCQVDTNSSAVRCAKGHKSTSPLCAVCETNYARVGTRCTECITHREAILVTILLVLIVVGIVAYIVYKRGERLTKQLNGKTRKQHSAVMRVLLNWLQVASTLSLAALKPPKEVSEATEAAQITDGVSLSFFPIQCALRFNLFHQTIAYMLLPIAAFVVPVAMTLVGFGVRWSMMAVQGCRVKREKGGEDSTEITDSEGSEGSSEDNETDTDGEDDEVAMQMTNNPAAAAFDEASGESSSDGDGESFEGEGESEDGEEEEAVRGDVVGAVLTHTNPMVTAGSHGDVLRMRSFEHHASQLLDEADIGAESGVARHQLGALIPGFSEKDVDRWMARFDGDGDGTLTTKEFEQLLIALERERFFVAAGAAAVIGAYYVYAKVTKACLGMFNWTDIERRTRSGKTFHMKTERYMSLDFSLAALDERHILMMVSAGLCLTIFSVAVPIVALALLVWNRRELDSFRVRGVFGFLLDGYRTEHFYWEAVVLARKITIVMVVYYQRDPFLQSLTATAVFALHIALQLAVQPFTSQLVNALDVLSMVLLFGSQLAAQIRWYIDDAEIKSAYGVPYAEILLVSLVIAHVALLVVFCWIIARGWLRDDKFGQKVRKRLVCSARVQERCEQRCGGRALEKEAASERVLALFADRRAELQAESKALVQQLADHDGATKHLHRLLADSNAVTSRARVRATTILIEEEGVARRVRVDHRSLAIFALKKGGVSLAVENDELSSGDSGSSDDDESEDDRDEEWFYKDADTIHGPYPFHRVLRWIDSGHWYPSVMVRRQRDGPDVALRYAVRDSASCVRIVHEGWFYSNSAGEAAGPHTLEEFEGWLKGGHFYGEMDVRHGVDGTAVTLTKALHWRCAGEESRLPAGWTEHVDSSSAVAYFHCAATGVTTYERPTKLSSSSSSEGENRDVLGLANAPRGMSRNV